MPWLDASWESDEVIRMATKDDEHEVVVAWRTNHRSTALLVESLPSAIWFSQVPCIPRRTVGMVAAHLHNSRCSWIRGMGARDGLVPPPLVDLRRVRQSELLTALGRSNKGIIELLRLGIANGGRVPRGTWQNFPTDLYHSLGYFAAHEGHHRGQLCMIARQLGHRLPNRVTDGIWQWTRLARA